MISVDTKRSASWSAISRPSAASSSRRAEPVEVRGHDFKDKDLGHAIPYGVYDLTADEGWVSVGIDHDTASSR